MLAVAAIALCGAVHLGVFDGSSLDGGWLVDSVLALAAAGTAIGTLTHSGRWWRTWGIGIAATSAASVALGEWWLNQSGQVTDPYPASFAVWVGAALWAIGVALSGWWSGPAAIRVLRVLTAPLTVFASFCLIESHYGYRPTVGILLDRPAPGQVSVEQLLNRVPEPRPTLAAPPRVGRYGPVTITGTAIGFHAATSYVWLPPDFDQVNHSNLPVVMVLPGTPGDAQDWVKAGQVLAVANHWADTHGGSAPVMIFVNENGARGDDTECVDGPQGNAETYLSQTVPVYLRRTLGVTADPRLWAIAGFSEGGTCAINLALRHPDVFGRFADLAGDVVPGWRNQPPASPTSLDHLYGGSLAAQAAHDPIAVLARDRYPSSEGWFASGRADRPHVTAISSVATAAQTAGIAVHVGLYPGGHNWIFARRSFAAIYPSLASSLDAGQPASLGPFDPSLQARLPAKAGSSLLERRARRKPGGSNRHPHTLKRTGSGQSDPSSASGP